jgi:hypothetical protein
VPNHYGLGPEAVADVLRRVPTLHADGTDARSTSPGDLLEAPGMSTEDLLRVVHAASVLPGDETVRQRCGSSRFSFSFSCSWLSESSKEEIQPLARAFWVASVRDLTPILL